MSFSGLARKRNKFIKYILYNPPGISRGVSIFLGPPKGFFCSLSSLTSVITGSK